MPFDVATAPARYAQLQAHVLSKLRTLTDEQAATPVPACPGWSVTDVVAHLAGLVAETLAGVPLPRGSDEATARQVADRRTKSLAEICDEWHTSGEAFGAFGERDPTYVAALTADLLVHWFDIAEVLDLTVDTDDDLVHVVAERYGQMLQVRAGEGDRFALSLQFIDGAELAAPGAGEATPLVLRISPFEFLRAVTGRRQRRQVEALEWRGDPTALLDVGWSQYGPLVG